MAIKVDGIQSEDELKKAQAEAEKLKNQNKKT